MSRAPIRVGVAGAHGRMGTLARETLVHAAGIDYAGGFSKRSEPASGIVDSLDALFARDLDVLVDFTVHPATVNVTMAAVAAGVRPVIGATGWTDAERETLAEALCRRESGAMLVPNFSFGAALMMRFAEIAAPYFPSVEIVERHHENKRDAPSGTARLTAERIGAVRHGGVPVHSVRMRGLLAHQEVLFGNDGELLTIRHDSLSRDSFAAGIVACTRRVLDVCGLEVGLDGVITGAGAMSSSA